MQNARQSCRFGLGCTYFLRRSEEWMHATGCKCCVSLKELKDGGRCLSSAASGKKINKKKRIVDSGKTSQNSFMHQWKFSLSVRFLWNLSKTIPDQNYPFLFYFTFIFTQWIYAFSRRFYPKWLTIEEHRQSITKPVIFTTPGLLGNKPRPELKCKGKINIIWYLLFYWFLNHFLYFSFYIYLIFFIWSFLSVL